jgi:hypothetical protein
MNQDLHNALWAAADKLRSNMDAAEYKHVVLGLIFLKYISDAFDERREALQAAFSDPQCELYIGDDTQIPDMLEDRDFYTMANVFWVPESARWEAIRNQAKQADIGKRIDDALIAIEQDNARLKGILDKRFARTQLEPGRLGELIDLVSSIGFGARDKAKDTLGEVYEYFLGQFASAEGKKGGQFYTPASVVKVLVDVLSPHKGKVYDPAHAGPVCGRRGGRGRRRSLRRQDGAPYRPTGRADGEGAGTGCGDSGTAGTIGVFGMTREQEPEKMIVDEVIDCDRVDTVFGKRWWSQVIDLTDQDIAALHDGNIWRSTSTANTLFICAPNPERASPCCKPMKRCWNPTAIFNFSKPRHT